MADDYRIRIELEHEEEARGLLDRFAQGLQSEVDELVRELREEDRLVASHSGNVVYVYADSPAQAERAQEIVEAELREHGLKATIGPVERWLDDEDRWETDPPMPDVEEELRQRGIAPWEVRVECRSHREAEELAERLEEEGYDVVRRWRYLLIGAGSKDEAEELAARLHGEAEPSSALVWEVLPNNPFAVFGGLAG
jgi:hypothetical protein